MEISSTSNQVESLVQNPGRNASTRKLSWPFVRPQSWSKTSSKILVEMHRPGSQVGHLFDLKSWSNISSKILVELYRPGSQKEEKFDLDPSRKTRSKSWSKCIDLGLNLGKSSTSILVEFDLDPGRNFAEK